MPANYNNPNNNPTRRYKYNPGRFGAKTNSQLMNWRQPRALKNTEPQIEYSTSEEDEKEKIEESGKHKPLAKQGTSMRNEKSKAQRKVNQIALRNKSAFKDNFQIEEIDNVRIGLNIVRHKQLLKHVDEEIESEQEKNSWL